MKGQFKKGGSNRASQLRTAIYERRVLADTTPGTLRNKTLTSALYKWYYDNGLFDSIKFLWAGEAGIRYAGGKVNKAYSFEQFNQEYSNTELITNGTFDSATGWTFIQPTSGSVTISGGVLRLNSIDGTLCQATFAGANKVVGKYYKIEFDIIGTYTGLAQIGSGTVEYVIPAGSTGHKSILITATETNFVIKRSSTCDITIDNLSVKEFLINDATQTVSGNQPYISGNIAPNETYCLKNVNGGAAYMTHPTISFASNQAWSMTTCITVYFKSSTDYYNFITNTISTKTRFGMGWGSVAASEQRPWFSNNANTNYRFTALSSVLPYIGKSVIVTFVADGNGNLSLYFDGVLKEAISAVTSFEINSFFGTESTNRFQGQFHTHQINSTALTATQVQSLYNTIRSFIPEIPSVVIGSQTWATSNVEQVANSAGTLITDGNAQATWATNAAAYWAHHTDAATGAIYGKLYNSQAKAVINAGAPSGYRVATKADWTTLITAGGNALKIGGTTYWLNDLGSNSTGFSAIGGGSRAANGTFSTIKATAQFWCGDTNEVLVLNSADNTATFITAETGAGYSIRLIKI